MEVLHACNLKEKNLFANTITITITITTTTTNIMNTL
jgi:hypothetical protein